MAGPPTSRHGDPMPTAPLAATALAGSPLLAEAVAIDGEALFLVLVIVILVGAGAAAMVAAGVVLASKAGRGEERLTRPRVARLAGSKGPAAGTLRLRVSTPSRISCQPPPSARYSWITAP